MTSTVVKKAGGALRRPRSIAYHWFSAAKLKSINLQNNHQSIHSIPNILTDQIRSQSHFPRGRHSHGRGLAPLVPIAPLPPPLPGAEKAVDFAPLLPATPLPPPKRAGPPAPPPEPPKEVPKLSKLRAFMSIALAFVWPQGTPKIWCLINVNKHFPHSDYHVLSCFEVSPCITYF